VSEGCPRYCGQSAASSEQDNNTNALAQNGSLQMKCLPAFTNRQDYPALGDAKQPDNTYTYQLDGLFPGLLHPRLKKPFEKATLRKRSHGLSDWSRIKLQ
jgi:hypothetical protein